jgi:hypothetical protein
MYAGGSAAMTDHWSVTVRLNGDDIVTIESNFLSGREIGPDEEEAIRTAAHHLLGFVGQERESVPAPCPVCGNEERGQGT